MGSRYGLSLYINIITFALILAVVLTLRELKTLNRRNPALALNAVLLSAYETVSSGDGITPMNLILRSFLRSAIVIGIAIAAKIIMQQLKNNPPKQVATPAFPKKARPF